MLLSVRFAIHSHIAFPPNTYVYFSREGRNTAISTVQRDGAEVFSFDGIDLTWITKYGPSETLIINENDAQSDQDIVHFRMGPEILDFRGGQIISVKYTVVNVMFEIDCFDPNDSDSNDAHIRKAESLLREFIDVYRWNTNEKDVRSYDSSATQIILIATADNYTLTDQHVSGTFKPALHRISLEHPILRGRRKSYVLEDVKIKLQNALQTENRLELYQELLLQARESYFIKRSYDLAVVTAETAFEVFLQHRLIAVCTSLSILTLDGKPAEKAIEEGNVRRNLFKYLEQLVPTIGVKARQEYITWGIDACDLRNAIVHRGKHATEAQANRSLEAVIKLIDYINTNLI